MANLYGSSIGGTNAQAVASAPPQPPSHEDRISRLENTLRDLENIVQSQGAFLEQLNQRVGGKL